MIATHATAADFSRWEAKAKAMSDAELLYSARDARAAAEAMRTLAAGLPKAGFALSTSRFLSTFDCRTLATFPQQTFVRKEG